IMLFRLRDLLWFLIAFILTLISLVEYRTVASFERLLSQKESELAAAESELAAAESELAAAESRGAKLKGPISELQEAIDGYKNYAELMRRFFLVKPQR